MIEKAKVSGMECVLNVKHAYEAVFVAPFCKVGLSEL